MNKRGPVKKTEKTISKKKEPTEITLSFNQGLTLLAQGEATEAYHTYRQAMGRACAPGD